MTSIKIIPKIKPGLVVLFGSGEMSPTGRKIHEEIFKLSGFTQPVKIGILETPTGFEVNAIHGWPERMQKCLETGLSNFQPVVSRIRAWRKEGKQSTDDPSIVNHILNEDYLYCGAGSPGYTIRNLIDSLAYRNLIALHESGGVLCLGSATAVAISRYAIPVYEIFKTGEDLHWLRGLDFFGNFGLNLAIVPHWNNKEGEDFDTTRCYMGKERFMSLVKMLPDDVTVLGIDEQTVAIFDFQEKTMRIAGLGSLHILKDGKEKEIKNGFSISWDLLSHYNLSSCHRVIGG